MILLVENFSSQLVFIVASKINEKDLMIFLSQFFSLSGRKVYKYIAKAQIFLILLTKIIVFSILLIPPIFGNIKKLRSLKSELVIGAIVYMIFGKSKSF